MNKEIIVILATSLFALCVIGIGNFLIAQNIYGTTYAINGLTSTLISIFGLLVITAVLLLFGYLLEVFYKGMRNDMNENSENTNESQETAETPISLKEIFDNKNEDTLESS